eukprot:2955904-Ditylum_brightwellii.AAC.2
MGHSQPVKPVMTDNSMACGIVNKTMKKRKICAINMWFYLVRDCYAHGHFLVDWALGTENKGSYHTKYHTGAHHKKLCPEYLYEPIYLTHYVKVIGPMGLQGCVEFGLSQDLLTHDPRNMSLDCSLG